MFEKILVVTDLSDTSECVLASLGGLKQVGTQEARLVYCVNARDAGSAVHQLAELAAPALERQRRMLETQGLKTESHLAVGLPCDEIEREAKANDCGLVVVAAHGESVSTDILLGGVAGAVIYNVSMPVLLVRLPCKGADREKGCEAWRDVPLRHVLFATDFSDNAEHAYEAGLRAVAARGADEVTLMHVQDKARIDRHLKDKLEEFNRIDTERLERLKGELAADGVKNVHMEIPYGSPKQEIVNRIGRGDISLVVMGTQGRGYIGEIFLGSVSHAVARHAIAPMLLVPAI